LSSVEGDAIVGIKIEGIPHEFSAIEDLWYDVDWSEFPITEIPPSKIPETIKELEKKMKEYAKALEFEKAAQIRDKIRELRRLMLQL
jgi:excinuclease UvrABC helicase subunit UvrB